MDEDVADLGGRDEACVAGHKVGGREGAGLDAERAEGQKGFLCHIEISDFLLFRFQVAG